MHFVRGWRVCQLKKNLLTSLCKNKLDFAGAKSILFLQTREFIEFSHHITVTNEVSHLSQLYDRYNFVVVPRYLMEGIVNWDKYCNEFCKEAEHNGKNATYCNTWLQYAKSLYEKKLPIIYNQKHLCLLLGYKEEYIYAASNSAINFYRTYKIPKKNGGTREISEPLPSLKEIQRWILDNVLAPVNISVYAKAYVKKKSIKENARFHKRQPIVLSLDVERFFDSITSDKIYSLFLKLGYKEDVSVLLTNLCCLNGCLPQGAPTSPMLSNIVLTEFDNIIGKYTNEKKIRYTRYADDMTFSGDFKPGQIISFVKYNLSNLGLKLNERKIRTRKKCQRQEVTGIVVNEKMQLPKPIRKQIRQEMYYVRKYGLESHMQYCDIFKENYLQHLKGRIQYGLFINPYDYELQDYLDYLDKVYGKY